MYIWSTNRYEVIVEKRTEPCAASENAPCSSDFAIAQQLRPLTVHPARPTGRFDRRQNREKNQDTRADQEW